MTFTRPNFRGRTVSLLAGPLAVLLLATATAVARRPALLAAVLLAGLAGLYDDLRGDATARR